MAGYFWQATEACRRCLTLPPDSIVKIEVEDDISIAKVNGFVESCEQLKHSEEGKTFSEESPLWWQTLDAWIRDPAPETAGLRLVTTSDLNPDSLLASCYQPTDVAPWDDLLAALDQRAEAAPNQSLKDKGVYDRWLNLQERRELLLRIKITSSQASLEYANELLDEKLVDQGVSPAIVVGVRKSFVGAFISKLTNSLDSGGFEVTAKEMNAAFLEAHARITTVGNYEFFDFEYTAEDIEKLRSEHHLHLIPQLDAIDKKQPQIVAQALENWFLARLRRQGFMDGRPHEIKDLKDHDKNLLQFCQTVHEEHDPTKDSEAAKNIGREVRNTCMRHREQLGRTIPPLDFSKGSFHELSNTLKLKWNPLYGKDI